MQGEDGHTTLGPSPPDSASMFGDRVLAETAIVLALDQDAALATVHSLIPGVKLCSAGRQATALSYSRDNAAQRVSI